LKLEDYGEGRGGWNWTRKNRGNSFSAILKLMCILKLPNDKIINDIIQKLESLQAPKGLETYF
jgi:hypothetical protein